MRGRQAKNMELRLSTKMTAHHCGHVSAEQSIKRVWPSNLLARSRLRRAVTS